jgi:type III pantothenate kinase
MNLTIDIGNSFSKILVFDDTSPVYRNVSRSTSSAIIKKICKNFPVENCMLSSVVNVEKSVLNTLKKIPNYHHLSVKTPLPVKNLYETPATLGNDRLANAIGGAFLFPGKNVLIIDAGTCIKYDFVNSRKEYIGGSITPGMEMRFRAMNYFTGKLPLIKPSEIKRLTGRSTSEAMQTGTMIGIEGEMNGFINQYRKKYKSLKIIITGGDAFRFADKLNLSIFAAADLVNIGLNEIIRHNTLN